nr:hypothetical protein [Nesterenkonia lacusekhoensis]
MVIDSRAEHRLVDGEYAARRRQCEQGAQLLGLQSLRELNDAGTTAEQLAHRLEGLTEDEAILRRLRHVLTENDRVLAARDALRAGRPADLGVILTSSHVSQRDDFQITVPETDTMVEALLEHGALGARQVGGGFGGCVIALAPSEEVPKLLAAAEANARPYSSGRRNTYLMEVFDGHWPKAEEGKGISRSDRLSWAPNGGLARGPCAVLAGHRCRS